MGSPWLLHGKSLRLKGLIFPNGGMTAMSSPSEHQATTERLKVNGRSTRRKVKSSFAIVVCNPIRAIKKTTRKFAKLNNNKFDLSPMRVRSLMVMTTPLQGVDGGSIPPVPMVDGKNNDVTPINMDTLSYRIDVCPYQTQER